MQKEQRGDMSVAAARSEIGMPRVTRSGACARQRALGLVLSLLATLLVAHAFALSAVPSSKSHIPGSQQALFGAMWQRAMASHSGDLDPPYLWAQILHRGGSTSVVTGYYQTVRHDGSTLSCRGNLQVADHCVLQFHDLYDFVGRNTIRLHRRITVVGSNRDAVGFDTRFALFSLSARKNNQQYFVPACFYCDNRHLPPYAIGADRRWRRMIVREDRLPLPIVLNRNVNTGTTITLLDPHPDGASFRGDQTASPVCSAELKFGSLGLIRHAGSVAEAFYWPGAEGDQTYMSGAHHAWVGRYHPLRNGYRDHYRLVCTITHTKSFNTAVAAAERLAWRALRPAVYRVNLSTVYRLQIALLNHYIYHQGKVIGIPFSVLLPSGGVTDRSLQIGFVGKQSLNAFELIHYGLDYHDWQARHNGEAIIHFWVHRSPIAAAPGLFRTWYDVDPAHAWRNYPTYLRVATDGAMGVLLAYAAERKADHRYPKWLQFCSNFGNWLHVQQRPDGAFYREFSNLNGAVLGRSKSSTLDAVHFLVDLFRVDGNARWLRMAERAGLYGEREFVHNSQFYGGTVDHPNVTDKEAGTIALSAFLSLYDATGQRHWLHDAVVAGNYAATWLYAWNVPMERGDPHCSFPVGRSTIGMSVIAAGASGADVYMAACWLDYYRLWLDTRDGFFRRVAIVLAYDTKQTMDINGDPHYGFPGLQDEATTLAVYRGKSVRHWLAWITANQLAPLTACARIFGTMQLRKLLAIPLKRQVKLNQRFMLAAGLAPSQ